MENSGKPIFIHSLFRSGSTYLFNVFRRSDTGYWCYQEPLHEVLSCIDTAPETLLAFHGEPMRHLRHPELARPYFYEFHEIREHLAGTFRKEFSYDYFFVNDAPCFPTDLTEYIRRLIDFAKGRAVLQFCRSSGRVRPLSQLFDAVHLHLWRNPRDQWWSYKTTDYFDAVTQLIYSAQELPPVLKEAKKLAAVTDVHKATVLEELNIAQNNILSSEDNYLVFFALWLYAFLECEDIADISINIDQLSQTQDYREKTLAALVAAGIVGLDLSDCVVSRAAYDQRDDRFFEAIEERVVGLFLLAGYGKNKIDQALGKISHVTRDIQREPEALIEIGSRSRQIALRYASTLAETQRLTTQHKRNQVELTAAITAKSTELTRALERLTTLESELHETCDQRDDLAVELTCSTEKMAALEKELIQARGLNSGQQENLAATREHLARLECELHSSKEMTAWLDKEQSRLRNLDDALRHDLISAKEKAAQAEGERTQAIEHIRTLLDDRGQLLVVLEDLRVSLVETQKRATQLERNLVHREEQVSTLKRELEMTTTQAHVAESELAQTMRRVEILEAELAKSQQWTLALEADLAQVRSQLAAKLDENTTNYARARWLEDEWNAATAKVAELNDISHRWWVTAEQLNQELQSVYRSRSWRITLPLRESMSVAKGVRSVAMRMAHGLLHKSKQAVKPAAAWAVQQTLRRPGLKASALNMLVRFPRVKHRLREFAVGAGIVTTPGAEMLGKHPTSDHLSDIGIQTKADRERLGEMPPRVAHIYAELKSAIGSHQQ